MTIEGARGPLPWWLKLPTLVALGLVALLVVGAGFGFLGRNGDAGGTPPALSEAAIRDDPATPTLAAADADVTIVMFFDYRCPACRRVHPVLERVRKADGRLRIVYKDWPVFAGDSITAAKVAIAAHWQGRHQAVHDQLIRAPGKLDEAAIEAAAMRAGVDWPRLRRDIDARGDEIDALLGRTLIQARALGLQGTPSFAIGPYLVQGALDDAGLKAAIAQARAHRRANPA